MKTICQILSEMRLFDQNLPIFRGNGKWLEIEMRCTKAKGTKSVFRQGSWPNSEEFACKCIASWMEWMICGHGSNWISNNKIVYRIKQTIFVRIWIYTTRSFATNHRDSSLSTHFHSPSIHLFVFSRLYLSLSFKLIQYTISVNR